MFFKDVGGEYELIFSDPIGPSNPLGGTWGANMVSQHGEIIFGAISGSQLHLYQHCPLETDMVRPIGVIETPSTGSGLEFGDVTLFEDYLFLTELHRPLLAEPDSGKVHVFRWKTGDLGLCPDLPGWMDPPEYLGAFGAEKIPDKLLVVEESLFVSFLAKRTWPIIEGGIAVYDLGEFDPLDVSSMDDVMTDLTADASMRVTYPNVQDFIIRGDDLFLVDRDNGLYRYSFDRGRYIGFYPAHRGPQTEAYMPREVVQSPEGVVPLYHPIALALTPGRRLVVQEHVTGRVSVFVLEEKQFLPFTMK
jgi:hypothetical protein